MATRTRQSVTGSSQQVLAASVSSLLEQQTHNEVVSGTGGSGPFANTLVESVVGRALGTQIIGSLMPPGTGLNAPVSRYLVTGLQKAAGSGLDTNYENRSRADVPTADLIRRSGFKTGSKLLIKVDPTRKTTNASEYIPQLVLDTFSLQSVAEPDQERYQLQETFEEEVLFLFGRQPRVWTLQGVVMNGKRAAPQSEDIAGTEGPLTAEQQAAEDLRLSRDMDYANRLLQDWDDYYRGSKAIENRARTYISYEDSVIEGTLLALTVVRNSQIPSAINATMTFVVHQRTFLGQETRRGLAAENIADIIDKNSEGQNKVDPSDIAAPPPTASEVQRQEEEAATASAQTQAQRQELEDERDRVRAFAAEQEQVLDQATEAFEQAQAGIAEANAVANDPASTQEEIDQALVDLRAFGEDANAAFAAQQQADAALQQVNERLDTIEEDLGEAQSLEDDALAKEQALASTAGNAS